MSPCLDISIYPSLFCIAYLSPSSFFSFVFLSSCLLPRKVPIGEDKYSMKQSQEPEIAREPSHCEVPSHEGLEIYLTVRGIS